jgi:hypothetical protein
VPHGRAKRGHAAPVGHANGQSKQGSIKRHGRRFMLRWDWACVRCKRKARQVRFLPVTISRGVLRFSPRLAGGPKRRETSATCPAALAGWVFTPASLKLWLAVVSSVVTVRRRGGGRLPEMLSGELLSKAAGMELTDGQPGRQSSSWRLQRWDFWY